ncbi:hypothetical protein REPUB_Repub08aG0204400 [Reevesia pubescens]
MADPSNIVPYDTLYSDDVLNFMYIQNPTLDDITTTQEIPSSIPQSSEQIGDDTIDPSDDPVIKNFCNEPKAEDSQAGSGEMNNQTETNMGTESLNNVYSTPLSGIDFTKLEIHGRLGIICHAILNDKTGSTNAVTPGHQYQMFDFCKKSIEDVKQFLTQYCIERIQAGYIMIKDPLSIFYEALCVGFMWDENLYNNIGDFVDPSFSNSGATTMDQAETSNNKEKAPKPSLTIQRERSRNLTMKEIQNHFHLPIQEAAKKLNFSATVVKKTCRKFGLKRWPQRQIKSIEKRESNWRSRLSSNDPEERARAENEIQSLQSERAKFGERSSKS